MRNWKPPIAKLTQLDHACHVPWHFSSRLVLQTSHHTVQVIWRIGIWVDSRDVEMRKNETKVKMEAKLNSSRECRNGAVKAEIQFTLFSQTENKKKTTNKLKCWIWGEERRITFTYVKLITYCQNQRARSELRAKSKYGGNFFSSINKFRTVKVEQLIITLNSLSHFEGRFPSISFFFL